MPSSRGSSQPRNQTQISPIAVDLYHLSHQESPQLSEVNAIINIILMFTNMEIKAQGER